MSTDLYGLVQMEKVSPSVLPQEPARYLPNLLTPQTTQAEQGYSRAQLIDLRDV